VLQARDQATTEDDDREAVARVLAGDRRAFGVLFERYAPMIHGLLLARVDAPDVDDLVQDVFEIALEKLGSLRDTEAIGAWLAQIARNRAIDLKRSTKKTEPLGPGTDDVPDEAASPSVRMEAKRILDLIRTLPEAYRETLVLRLVEGMSGPEIAAQVGLTAESVRVNLHRGMKMLKERLA
jgi:RNA polymerase sigma-70 factor (ECF subfamily)